MTECCKGLPFLSLQAPEKLTPPRAEFVLAIASEANEICEKDLKKTMLPEHILAALKVRPPHLPLARR